MTEGGEESTEKVRNELKRRERRNNGATDNVVTEKEGNEERSYEDRRENERQREREMLKIGELEKSAGWCEGESVSIRERK